MACSNASLLFVIVGKNEPLYEYNKVQAADSVTRQNYFVLHSALDLVEKAAYTTTNMYLKVVDKVRGAARSFFTFIYLSGGLHAAIAAACYAIVLREKI